MKNKTPLVGIIVPIYRVDLSLIEKCIISIVGQTYKAIEIILVDDGNDEEYVQQLEKISRMDVRIKLIHQSSNLGLYSARLAGVKNCFAEYITFVDADDSITVDWIRLLVKNAIENDSDIVMGRTINIDENGWKYVYNANYSLCNHSTIIGENILQFLMQDKGLDFSIHTMWNKLYKKRLWDRAWEDLSKINKHLIMTEDVLFSFILFYHAHIMSFSAHDGYFYYRNQKSATKTSGSLDKIEKNISDLGLVFSEVEDFLKRVNKYEDYELCWNEWKNRYFRWWSYTIRIVCEQLSDKDAKTVLNAFLNIFNKSKLEFPEKEDSYFEEKKISWNNQLENIKKKIISDDYDVISFDLFDTLIVRPVLNPDDVMEVVVHDTNIQLSKKNVIKSLRKLAEKKARKNITNKYPQYEDVNLSEIYNVLCDEFGVSKSVCEKLMLQEVEVEIEFAKRRNIGYELFTLAQECGKRVFITSDMYLDESTIKRILNKNGYYNCSLLLSSKERMLKATGHLFEKLIDTSNMLNAKIIHIGDNWESDYIIPKRYGITSFFLPKTKDVLLNYLGDASTGNSVGKVMENIENIIDCSKHFDNFPIRCMYANVANNMFDNPFVSFYGESDYNGDPYYFGNFALGMHMFGIAKWLSDLVDKNRYTTVHFTARDGYYLKVIYDRIRKNKKDSCGSSNYLYTSRKALIPVEIENKNDIDIIYTNSTYSGNTARKIIERYRNVLQPTSTRIEDCYRQHGFFMDKTFANEEEWFKFVQCLKEMQYSEEQAKNNYRECQKYFKDNIKKGDLIFDLGYSGKLHCEIIKTLGFSVDGAYVNFSGYDAVHKNKKEKLNISSYYDFIPSMHGIVTEYIFSDRGPSCKEYKNGKPIFEDKMHDVIGDYVVREINRGAFVFADTFLESWEDRMELMDILHVDAGLQYEKFLVAPTKFDQAIFNCCYVEDEYYGGIKNKEINEVWNWQLCDRNVKPASSVNEINKQITVETTAEEMAYKLYIKRIIDRSIFVKALYWICVDKEFFWSRVRDYITRKDKI